MYSHIGYRFRLSLFLREPSEALLSPVSRRPTRIHTICGC